MKDVCKCEMVLVKKCTFYFEKTVVQSMALHMNMRKNTKLN